LFEALNYNSHDPLTDFGNFRVLDGISALEVGRVGRSAKAYPWVKHRKYTFKPVNTILDGIFKVYSNRSRDRQKDKLAEGWHEVISVSSYDLIEKLLLTVF